VALPYAVEHLTAAVHTLAATDEPLADRLQRTWTDHVQELWRTMCLPTHLNERFRAMWPTYTERDESNPHTSVLRAMSGDELDRMARDIVALALDTVAADARGEEPAPKPG
jgi:hypothetical protein